MKKEIPPQGSPLRGFFPQNKIREKPLKVFLSKITLSYFSSNMHYAFCVQSCEGFLSK